MTSSRLQRSSSEAFAAAQAIEAVRVRARLERVAATGRPGLDPVAGRDFLDELADLELKREIQEDREKTKTRQVCSVCCSEFVPVVTVLCIIRS